MKIQKPLLNRYERGQTLIEVLVALGAAVAVLFGITVAVISSLNNAQFTENQNLANKYAAQGMEIIRQLRDSTSSGLQIQYPSNCLDKDGNLVAKGLYGCEPILGTLFVREFDLEPSSLSCSPSGFPLLKGTLSTVLVSWADSACTDVSNRYCHKVKLISCFSNPATISAP